MQLKTIICSLLLTLCGCATVAVHAPRTRILTAKASVPGSDAKARNAALQQARESAVSDAVTTVLGSKLVLFRTMQIYFTNDVALLYTPANSITHERVVSSAVRSNITTLAVEFTVDEDRLAALFARLPLGAVLRSPPVVYIAVDESASDARGKSWKTTAAGIALEARFSAAGYIVTVNATNADCAVKGEVRSQFFKLMDGAVMRSYRASAALRSVSRAGIVLTGVTAASGSLGGTDEDAAQISMRRLIADRDDIGRFVDDTTRALMKEGAFTNRK